MDDDSGGEERNYALRDHETALRGNYERTIILTSEKMLGYWDKIK
jgi:hypothetical protein